ncbi:MAG TPA: hypothetical protein PKK10_10480 [Woeseiaceae bacterium]|nr:hypothetical protein [Woeseiaceae bacterium]
MNLPQANAIFALSGVVLMFLLSACAIDRQPAAPASSYANETKPRLCRSGDTHSCVERMGVPTHCFCADKDSLRELLDPLAHKDHH